MFGMIMGKKQESAVFFFKEGATGNDDRSGAALAQEVEVTFLLLFWAFATPMSPAHCYSISVR